MKNPERQSAHEIRLCKELDRIEEEMDRVQELPATPLNRLKLIQLELRAQVLLHSFYIKDPQETITGIYLLGEETTTRRAYEVCLSRVTSLINNAQQWEGQRVDLSTIESWVKQPQYHA